MPKTDIHQDTKAIHAADGAAKSNRPLRPAILQTAPFEVKTIEEQSLAFLYALWKSEFF